MENMTIKSNYHWNEFRSFDELTPKQQAEFDYLTDSEKYEREYIVYRGWAYTLDDFMNLGRSASEPEPFKKWDGYHSDSFFSGVLIKIHEFGDAYQIGTYYS